MAVLAGVLSAAAGGASASVVGYDASGNTLPGGPDFTRYDANHLFSLILGNGYNAPQSVAGGVYAMGPSDQAKYTFWYSASQVLDHTKTVEISARLRLASQSSVNPTDRAGLAIGLTNDQNLYQEMYINAGEVFINKAGRVRDVAFALDATAWHDYTLRVQGGLVSVDVDGVTRLTGSMFVPTGAPTQANWAVVGDITSSAAGSFEMTSFQVAVVPEPVTAGLVGMTPLLFRRVRR
jgi:hypothetical protein